MSRCTSCGKVIADEDGIVKIDGMSYHPKCAKDLGIEIVSEIVSEVYDMEDESEKEIEKEPLEGPQEKVEPEDAGSKEDIADVQSDGAEPRPEEEAEMRLMEGQPAVIVREDPEEPHLTLYNVLPNDDPYNVYLADWEAMYNELGPNKVIETYNNRKKDWIELAEELASKGLSKEEIEAELDYSIVQHKALKEHMDRHKEAYSIYTADDEGYLILKAEQEPEEEAEEEPTEEEESKRPMVLPRRRPKKSKPKKDPQKRDPDSLGAKWDRFLKKQQGWVDLITLSRNERTGEFIKTTELVKRSELPRDAVAVTGYKKTYCLDTIKRSNWYKETHDEAEIFAATRGFTASEAKLYMTSNKIDNALAVNWTEWSNVDVKKYFIFGAIGLLAIVLFVMLRR